MESKKQPNTLIFKGANFLRQRLVLSVLTGKSITVSQIRPKDTDPGLREYEVNLLRLVDKLTNGTWLEVSETGTCLAFTPGSLIGGTLDHDCSKSRGIGYYLEVLFALAPFCKKPLHITLRGVTNNMVDPSVDSFKHGGIAALKHFIVVDPGIDLKINRRGVEPEGGGEVVFTCPGLKLKAIQKKDMGKVKRVRGQVFALRVSPSLSNRFIEAAKGQFLKYLPDVFLTTDHLKGANAGKSPGFGGCLVSETTTGCVFTSDRVSEAPPAPREVAEDMGRTAAWSLFEEISRGGIVDSSFQSLALLYMAMTQKDVSQIVLGPLSPYTIEFLRHLRTFLGLVYKLETYVEDEGEDEGGLKGTSKVVVTGVGVGYNKLT